MSNRNRNCIYYTTPTPVLTAAFFGGICVAYLFKFWSCVFLWKESLNSDGQQLFQHQQNEHLLLTFIHLVQKRPRHIILKIYVLPWDRHKNVEELHRLMGFKHSPFDNRVLQRQYIYKMIKTYTDSHHYERPHTLTKKSNIQYNSTCQ